MAQRSVWEVDTVRAQAKFLSITGAMKTVYYVLWRGFAAAEVKTMYLFIKYCHSMPLPP